MWIFEPHAAEKVFEGYVKEFAIQVDRDEWLDRAKGVKKDGARIASITTLSGKTYTGKMFIDASYEGDLMAAAGVPYHIGRESNSVYGEKWNGVQVGVLHHRHHFGVLKNGISPYVVPGDPKSGVARRRERRATRHLRRRRQARAGLLLPHVPHEPTGEPCPVCKTGWLRPEAIRAARSRLCRGLAGDVREVRPDPEPQDRHEQPRALQL
jgi:hypothetical protein